MMVLEGVPFVGYMPSDSRQIQGASLGVPALRLTAIITTLLEGGNSPVILQGDPLKNLQKP